MNLTKWLVGSKIVALLILTSLVSCSADDSDEPQASLSYVGTWQEDDANGVTDQVKTYRNILILEKDSYTLEFQALYLSWETFWGRRGAMSIVDSKMTQFSIQSYEAAYNDNGDYIGNTYQDLDVTECDTVVMKWSIKGNKLTLITDVNENGIFDPINDVADIEETYTKL